MSVFVAGATGVLGRRVVRQLTAAGHDVVAVARSDAKAAQLRSAGARPVTVDLFDPGAVRTAVAGSDVVMNLATAVPPSQKALLPGAWATHDRLRTEASRNLVDAALDAGAVRYVQEALSFCYPDRGEAWIDESAPLDVPTYATSVLAAEAQAQRFTTAVGADGAGVALRFGLFYAADSQQVRDLLAVALRGLWLLPGSASQFTSWIHVDDAAAAVVASLGLPSGAYNVVEDVPSTNAGLLEVLGQLLGRRVRQLPAWLGLGPLALQTRSLRVSNAKLRAASSWRCAFPDRRAGLARVLAAVADDEAQAP